MPRSERRLPDVRRRLLLASRSAGKVREIQAMFAASGWDVVDLQGAGVVERDDEDELESAETFEANALAKARHFHALTGLPTIADDSGIEVAALGGAPGVYSKRWSGRTDVRGQELDDANNTLLLERLRGKADRSARYVCAAVYRGAYDELVERGEVSGRILDAPRGSGGFGYDPYFLSDELGRTFAEVTMAEKATVSHRARAFRRLLQRLSTTGAGLT